MPSISRAESVWSSVFEIQYEPRFGLPADQPQAVAVVEQQVLAAADRRASSEGESRIGGSCHEVPITP